jgi:hypothetical protein
VHTNDGVPAALGTAWIVRRSRAVGRVGQIEDPLLCRLRDALLKAVPTSLQLRQFERMISYQKRFYAVPGHQPLSASSCSRPIDGDAHRLGARVDLRMTSLVAG